MEGERRFDISKNVTLETQWEQGGYLFHFGIEQGLPSDIDIEVRVLDADVHREHSPDRTVFVIGGAGEDLDVMKPFLLSMAKEGVQVVGVSMPSYGHSSDADHRWRVNNDGNDKIDFADYSRLIAVVHEHLESNHKPQTARTPAPTIDIVGHSLGGSIVADFATRYADRIHSVHLVAPAGQHAYGSLPGLRLPPKLFTEFLFAHASERLKQIPDILKGDKEIPPVVKNLWINSFAKDGGLINSMNDLEKKSFEPRFIQRFWEGKVAAQGKLSEQLGVIASAGTPVTIYALGADKLFPKEEFQTLVNDHVQVEVLEGLPHYGILDRSDVVAHAIRQHMND